MAVTDNCTRFLDTVLTQVDSFFWMVSEEKAVAQIVSCLQKRKKPFTSLSAGASLPLQFLLSQIGFGIGYKFRS